MAGCKPGDIDPKDWTEEDKLRHSSRVRDMITKELKYPLEFEYAGYSFTCFESVLPGLNENFVHHLPLKQSGGNRVLEIGSGTGCASAALFLHRKQVISTITATDISTEALNNTEFNFKRYSIPGRCIISDLFNDIDKEERFDLIFWNFPYAWSPLEGAAGNIEKAMADPHYSNVCRYVKEAGDFLTSGGKVVLMFSPTIGNLSGLVDVAGKQGKRLKLLWEEELQTRFIKSKLVQIYEVTDP